MCYGPQKKSKYYLPTYLLACVTPLRSFNRFSLCFLYFRVLHKGSIPAGQLITPKPTHTNIATWSEMSMLFIILYLLA